MTPTIKMSRLAAIASFALGVACAHPLIGAETGDPFQPRGPGHVFSTVEAAAIDALAYSHLQLESSKQLDHMAGGTIRAVRGGYTYDGVETAPASSPTRIKLILRRNDVARFHAYPRLGNFRADRMNERVSRSDRDSVDDVDPVHRPIFVLTPRMSVIAYRGEVAGTDGIANLRSLHRSVRLAGD